MDIEAQIRLTEATDLTALVRRAVGRDTLAVTDWRCEPLTGGSTQAAGVYRLTGIGDVRGAPIPWSLVLKCLAIGQSAAQRDPTHVSYWRREPLVYQSGLLVALDGGLAAPRCYGVTERSDGVWLWLEDVGDAGRAWPLARYALAARHLGNFSGASLADQVRPRPPWLARGLLRGRSDGRLAELAELTAARDRPAIRRVWSGDLVERTLRLAAERHALLHALDRLPQVVQHGDASRKNLFARRRPDGRDETVAIDWGWAGVGAIGEDAATLVAGSAFWFHVDTDDLTTLREDCFEGYVAGLREAGWRGSPRSVRLGMSAAFGLRFALVPVIELWDERRRARLMRAFGRPFEEICARVAALRRFALDQADEARAILLVT